MDEWLPIRKLISDVRACLHRRQLGVEERQVLSEDTVIMSECVHPKHLIQIHFSESHPVDFDRITRSLNPPLPIPLSVFSVD